MNIRMNLWHGYNHDKLMALAKWLDLDKQSLPLTSKHPLFSDSYEYPNIFHVDSKSFLCKKCDHGKYIFKEIKTTRSILSSIFNQTH